MTKERGCDGGVRAQVDSERSASSALMFSSSLIEMVNDKTGVSYTFDSSLGIFGGVLFYASEEKKLK